MDVLFLSSFPHDSVEAHGRIFTDVNDGLVSFLSNGKELAVGMDSDRSNTISVGTFVGLELVCSQVESLVTVTSHVDDHIVF